MSASHPTFKSGHCFMAKTLSKPEVEYAGEVLVKNLRKIEKNVPKLISMEDYRFHLKQTNKILKKMDYPLFEAEIETKLYFDILFVADLKNSKKNPKEQRKSNGGFCLAKEAEAGESGYHYNGKIYVPAWPAFYNCIADANLHGNFYFNEMKWIADDGKISSIGRKLGIESNPFVAIATPVF